ncbi:MAG TPA: SRPBCC family protein, partial [Methylomirabilota bacterium]|nr:SRPBCC family protein [Methylomirabilota bacterium]
MIRVRRSAVIDAPIERVWAVLRDFNSHSAWHPAVGPSTIERGEPADQVGCVRDFTLKDGNQIREQLLALSDRDHVSTYCILDATLPMRNYVATVQLKRVTDGDRTFWHWESTFDVPRGREREFEQLVGGQVYEAGFTGLAAFLGRGGRQSPALSVTDVQGMVAMSFGGPEVLQLRRLEALPPRSGEVRLRQTAIGVNYIDVYIRAGLYRMIEPPAPIGMEAAGVVVESNAPGFSPGDRVAYACSPPGAYVTMRTLPAAQLVLLPDHVDEETAAALMLKGMTAEYLLYRLHRVRPGDTVLVHAAAGGVGLLLCQWAQALGARVIGTVSSDAKAELARANGCEHPIVTRSYIFAEKTKQLTGGRGADVIYDGLGRDAAQENLAALATRGHWVSYGQATGALDPVNLSAKSGTFSQPVLF